MFIECPCCPSDAMHHTLTIFPNTHSYLCHAPAEGGRGLAGTEQWAGGEPSGLFGRPAAWRRSRMEEGGLRSGHTSSIAHPPPQERAADRKPPVEDIGVDNEKGSSEEGKGKKKDKSKMQGWCKCDEGATTSVYTCVESADWCYVVVCGEALYVCVLTMPVPWQYPMSG